MRFKKKVTMQINNKLSYFRIIDNKLEETSNRNERSSLKEILNFLNDVKIEKSQETIIHFKAQWPIIKANYEEKKLKSKYGLLGVFIRTPYKLFFENHNTIVSQIDSRLEVYNFTLSLVEWVQDPNTTGAKDIAANLIASCKAAPWSRNLDLSGLDLNTLPECITEISHLEKLDLKLNEIKALPESIGNLVNLKELDLSLNKIKALPESLGNLRGLNKLNLKENKLRELPESLGNLRDLNKLNLKENKLRELPVSIENLIDLNELDLENNHLRVIPESIGNLINLKKLSLGGNKLQALPKIIGNFVNLEILHLNSNKIQALPESIGNLIKLKELDLNFNKIQALPESIGNLIKLEELHLNFNEIQTIPESTGNLVNLTALGVIVNQLKAIPQSIGNLVNLTVLLLMKNHLEAMPESIGNLVNLMDLNLRDNKLQAVPESIRNLVNLNVLDLGLNQLQDLPESLGNFQKLREFRVNSNSDLVDLPIGLGNIPTLTFIDRENTNIPIHVVDAILNACEMLRKSGSINSLPILLNKWLKIAYKEQETASLLEKALETELKPDEKNHLNEWLIRLEKTKDFQNNQSRLAQTTGEMLKALLDSEEFRTLFFPQIEFNNTACEDRSAMAYNEIYLSFCLCVKANELSEKEKLLMMLKGARTQALMKDLSALFGIHQSETGLIEQESVEIYLYYLTRLREPLDLLLAIQDMRYKAIGHRDWIDEESLIDRVNENTIDELVSLSTFENLLKKSDEFNQELERLIEESNEKLKSLDNNSLEWLQNMNSVKKEFETQKEDLLKKWAFKLINNS